MTRAAMQKALLRAAATLGTAAGDGAVLDTLAAVTKALKPPRRKPKKSEE